MTIENPLRYKKISKCRICDNTNLVPVVDLGSQALTGIFPKTKGQSLTSGPLRLVKCHEIDSKVCGLLQLEHSYDSSEMYGDNYGYRSGLNASMVDHLKSKVQKICATTQFEDADLVIDIGCNDGTTLGFYPKNLQLVGIDPTINKFLQFIPKNIDVIPEFFSSKLVKDRYSKKAKIITSFSMFYDLEDPIAFAKDISESLDENGKWIFEQSYMPTMLESLAYDTICHEHLEFYGLHQIEWLINKAGLKIVDVELNDINGGSFSVTAMHQLSNIYPPNNNVSNLLKNEVSIGLDGLDPYLDFQSRIEGTKQSLVKFIDIAKKQGKTIMGIGASTKGNVLLQYCNLGPDSIPFIGDVNPDKFGHVTPGTFIPIVDEVEVLNRNPDYLLILPWHFKNFFLNNPLYKGKTLVFPLPTLEVVNVL